MKTKNKKSVCSAKKETKGNTKILSMFWASSPRRLNADSLALAFMVVLAGAVLFYPVLTSERWSEFRRYVLGPSEFAHTHTVLMKHREFDVLGLVSRLGDRTRTGLGVLEPIES